MSYIFYVGHRRGDVYREIVYFMIVQSLYVAHRILCLTFDHSVCHIGSFSVRHGKNKIQTKITIFTIRIADGHNINNIDINIENNKHAYGGTNDCLTHLRVLLVVQAPRHGVQAHKKRLCNISS